MGCERYEDMKISLETNKRNDGGELPDTFSGLWVPRGLLWPANGSCGIW